MLGLPTFDLSDQSLCSYDLLDDENMLLVTSPANGTHEKVCHCYRPTIITL